MRSIAGVRIDEEGSPVDHCTVYTDLFGDMFIDQGGQTVALPLAFQEKLVDVLLENIDRHTQKPAKKCVSKPVLAMGMMMSMVLVVSCPALDDGLFYHKKAKRSQLGAPTLIETSLPMPKGQT